MIESSIPALLQERAHQQADTTAYTFIDYDVDPNGFAESLTWSQVYRRAVNVAEELRHCGSIGDRAAILAPQGLDYIVAFLGALQAGFIAVPLPVPLFGVLDERVSSALRDCSPSVILTTSSAVDDIGNYARADGGDSAPLIIEIDSIDLDFPRAIESRRASYPSVAYLQYTSGSTGQPAGVVISHQNVISQLRTNSVRLLPRPRKCPAGTDHYRVVAALLSRHGVDARNLLPSGEPTARGVTEPGVVLATTSPLDAVACQQSSGIFQRTQSRFRLGGAKNIRRTTWPGMISGMCWRSTTAANEYTPATIARFSERFARFNLSESAIRPSYGLAEATVYVATSKAGQPPNTALFDYEQLSAGHGEAIRKPSRGRHRAGQLSPFRFATRADRQPRDQNRERRGHGRRNLGARRKRGHGILA